MSARSRSVSRWALRRSRHGFGRNGLALHSADLFAVLLVLFLALSGWNHAHATSVGGVMINDRGFDLSNDSSFSIDDDVITLQQLSEHAAGDDHGWRTSNVVVNPNATLTSGSISQLNIENNLKGPITSISPLSVLGQPFSVNGDSVLRGFTDTSQLTVGQFLEVSGYVDANSSIAASRVSLESPMSQWKISGYITQFNGATSEATIGSPPGGQPIRFVGVSPTNCGAGPAVGDYVSALANPIASFSPGQVVDTVTQLRCRPLVPGGSAGAQGSFEGLVQLIVDPTSFKLAGYTVVHGASTLYKAGNVDDLDAGVRVEVEGTFSSATTLNARRIEFILPSIRFRAPVLPAQVVPEASITILGNTVHNNLHNRDEDGIMAGGLAVTTHLEVRAYQDSLGQLYATRVRSRGAPDPNDYNLQAPVESIARPNLIALGLTIDTASSTFQDNAHASITADQFFAAVALGTLVEIEEANFDSVNHRLYGGIVFLSDDGAAGSLRPQGAIPQNASVGGTLSIISLDMVFTNSFEAP